MSRVSYVLSASLVEASDALPSNLGRSSTLHHLIAHLGLVDLEVDELIRSSDPATNGMKRIQANEDEDEDEDEDEGLDEEVVNKIKLRELFALDSESVESGIPRLEQNKSHRARIIRPKEASERELSGYHASSYIQSLLDEPLNNAANSGIPIFSSLEAAVEPVNGEPSRKRARLERSDDPDQEQRDEVFGLTDDNPRFSLLASHVRLIAGAALVSAEELIKDRSDVVIAWDGGRHHAKRSSASGFCYINDAVLAILALCKPRLVKLDRAESGVPNGDEASFSRSPIHSDASNRILGFGCRPSDIQASVASQNIHSKVNLFASATRSSAPDLMCGSIVNDAPKNKKTKSVLKQSRVLYIDLDLHWGDGVEEAFFNSSSVVTLSIHMFAPGFFPCGLSNRPNKSFLTSTRSSSAANCFQHVEASSTTSSHPPGSLHGPSGPSSPSRAAHSALNLVLRPGAGPDTLARIMKTCVEPFASAYKVSVHSPLIEKKGQRLQDREVLRSFIFPERLHLLQPDYVVVQSGVDALAGDPTSTFNFSSTSILSAVSLILSWKVPTLILGGGGYHTPNAAKCWAGITALTLGRWSFDPKDSKDRPGESLSNESQIPDSDAKHWEIYSPDFSLEIREGNMRDENDEGYLLEVEKVFQGHIDHWRRSD